MRHFRCGRLVLPAIGPIWIEQFNASPSFRSRKIVLGWQWTLSFHHLSAINRRFDEQNQNAKIKKSYQNKRLNKAINQDKFDRVGVKKLSEIKIWNGFMSEKEVRLMAIQIWWPDWLYLSANWMTKRTVIDSIHFNFSDTMSELTVSRRLHLKSFWIFWFFAEFTKFCVSLICEDKNGQGSSRLLIWKDAKKDENSSMGLLIEVLQKSRLALIGLLVWSSPCNEWPAFWWTN